MAIAGELIASGADNSLINRLVYHNEPAGKVKMHAYALERLHLYSEGRIATAMLTESEMDPFGPEAYTEGIVEKLRDIDTVEIAAFLRQKGKDVKVSLRAKKYADVARIAASRKGAAIPGQPGTPNMTSLWLRRKKSRCGLPKRSFKHAGRSSKRIKTAGNELQ